MKLPAVECKKYKGGAISSQELGLTGSEDFTVREGDYLVQIIGSSLGDLLIGIILQNGRYTPENLLSMVKLMRIERKCLIEPQTWQMLDVNTRSGFRSNLTNPYYDRRERPLIREKQKLLK